MDHNILPAISVDGVATPQHSAHGTSQLETLGLGPAQTNMERRASHGSCSSGGSLASHGNPRGKRRRTEDETDAIDVTDEQKDVDHMAKRNAEIEDVRRLFEQAGLELRSIASDKENKNRCKLNKEDLSKFTAVLTAALQIVENSIIEKHDYGILLNQRNEQIRLLKAQTPRTYADAALKTRKEAATKRPPISSGPNKPKVKAANKPTTTVVITATTESGDAMSAENVRQKLMAAVNPKEAGIQVKNVRAAKNGKVYVETRTKQDSKKLSELPQIRSAGLNANIPKGRKPRLILYDVPRSMEPEEVRTTLFLMNADAFEDLGRGAFEKGCSFLFRTGKRDAEVTHWVLETSPEIRDRFRRQERLYLGWRRCRVQDYISLSRCYKCQGLGHIGKYCRAKEETCGHCGGSGHKKEACASKDQPAKCALCSRRGKPCDHSVMDPKCPSYKIAYEAYTQSVDYGDPVR